MPSARDILAQERIEFRDRTARYYTTCPQCSASRKPHNRKKKCLGVTIDREGCMWGCNHCSFHGGAFFDEGKGKRESRPARPQERPSGGGYAQLQRGSRSGWR